MIKIPLGSNCQLFFVSEPKRAYRHWSLSFSTAVLILFIQLGIMESVDKEALHKIALQLCRPGHGILAADESVSTVGKRLVSHGLTNDSETRRSYRSMLVSSPELAASCSGVILFHETLYQTPVGHSGTFASFLSARGVLPGIKVDTGLRPMSEGSAETHTSGLEDEAAFRAKLAQYHRDGARFCKWRAALRIDAKQGFPSDACVSLNSEELATYAKCAVLEGIVPIVEPEVLIDGDHDADLAYSVSVRVIRAVYEQLLHKGVPLDCTLLKPMMIVPGIRKENRDVDTAPLFVAQRTLSAMQAAVPQEVPGIMFLSGGMNEMEATASLNALNALANGQNSDKKTWMLSFSFGRALQTTALKFWVGSQERVERAGHIVAKVIQANGQATLGEFTDSMHPVEEVEGVETTASLYEGFRGWRGSVDAKGV